MQKTDISFEMKRRAKEIDEILMKFLPKEAGYQKIIMEAMNYSILSGGKRLRPMLMWECYRMFGGSGTVIEPFLAAIEMIHTYSLVHDDLPAMDDDAYRRGRKTTHVVYGEAMGILAGDALLNYAFETAAGAFGYVRDAIGSTARESEHAADANRCAQDEMRRIAWALQILARKAGIYGMIGGQTADVQNEGSQTMDGGLLDFIYRKKTGALLEASMMIGAVLAGADEKEAGILEEAAGMIGVAFQIQDDVLDVSGTFEELGKPIGSDEKNKKVTYVSLHGMEAAKAEAERLTEEAVARIVALRAECGFLRQLLDALTRRRS